ncbi:MULTISPECIES: AAA family ATPase [Bacillus cereus group]|uniref:AAA family ATPase n=1 Tax=Bacillus cereus TaxID=1396 RepID=A0AA44QC88_BACCE|nr:MULTISPECIES: AAA family ATPase [Bacillus cereus group]EEL49489.1 ABC transporter, ATP-binding protein [Bacillus cereus Rock3-44]PFA24119.1 AAA family ATPase [Bacillus cereus]PFN09557.1 AAA family ATPase [Bacillus cereus]PFO81465.1 AAA family ATPase [Bacillus cereus]PFS03860.1 AAA family ATPase [Bacillus cereus]
MNEHTSFLKSVSLQKEQIPSFSEYPYCLPAIRTLQSLHLHPNVTFLVGENGTGKSTLLEAVAVALGFNAEGGTKNFRFTTYDSHSSLYKYIRITKGLTTPKDGFFLRAESFYNLASYIDEIDSEPLGGGKIIDSYGGISLHNQSHGESFFSLFMNRFSGQGLYVLDEPEAALSPMRQLSMLIRMHELVEQGSQFIIATHSPILMAYPESNIYSLTQEGIYESNLEETEHYQTTKLFFENRDRLFHHLFQS